MRAYFRISRDNCCISKSEFRGTKKSESNSVKISDEDEDVNDNLPVDEIKNMILNNGWTMI